ncbi:MAG: protein-L-isoaspartate(D-aspartate) O-methyltransferase [Rhodospirillaceae bacterium]|nr:MAG: protein-L-isoaspartate(D-aspartate) O-methyltransferase [Rhodospirillaceae bacterium]
MEEQWVHLLREISANAQKTATHTGRATLSERVMAAMARVPHAAFIPELMRYTAYINQPLPIGHGQTISQPFIVAMITNLLNLAPIDRMLEIGSGYSERHSFRAGGRDHLGRSSSRSGPQRRPTAGGPPWATGPFPSILVRAGARPPPI